VVEYLSSILETLDLAPALRKKKKKKKRMNEKSQIKMGEEF
jgi:hypothetical protein